MTQTRHQILRFLAVGLMNTVLTSIIFLVLAGMISYVLAYVISYAMGVLFNTCLVPRLVFQSKPEIPDLGKYVIWNVCVAIFGAVIAGICQALDFDRLIALIVVMAIVVPINFLVSRRILT